MKKITLFLLFLCCYLVCHANWQRSVTNHNRRIYKAANQNWMVAQHPNGWMYFANNKGLLEFDGVSWSTYSIHNAKTRAVKSGNDGRIYVGGLGQFGYFTPNSKGGLDYTCLSDSLQGVSSGNIWNIHVIDDRVYFQSDRTVFYLENDQIYQIPDTGDIVYSAIASNKFYIVGGSGLSILNGEELSLIPNTKEITQSKVVGIVPFKDKVLIVTSRHGLYLFDRKEVRKHSTKADSFLQNNQLFCSALKDSILALGSVQDGVLLLNTETNETEHFSITNGLQNKTVLSLLFDRENNLWLGLDNGIDCINLNASMFFLYSNKSAIGSGYTSNLYNGKLYLGTNQGLYVTDYPIVLNKETNLQFVEGAEGQVWSVLAYDNKLFCGGGNSLIVVDKDKISRLKGIRGVWSILPLKNQPDVLIAGTYNGLYILRKDKQGKWFVSHRVEGINYSSKTMFIEELNNNIWIANKESGLYRVTLSEDLKSGAIKNYNSSQLPAGDNVYVSQIDDNIIIASRQGLFRYNEIKDQLEKFTPLEELLDGNVAYTYILQDQYKDIWYVTDGMLKLARYSQEKNTYIKNESESYLKGFLIEDFEHIRIYNENQAVIGTEEGFSLLQFNRNPTKKFPLNLQIRKVYLTIGKDSLAYGRSYSYDETPLIIPYKYNSIRIEYSVNNYDKSLTTLYSYQLKGSDNEAWSEYNENISKEYTNLKEGKYSFNLKIITNKDKEPVMTSFEFEVLPPYYRTWWAYTLYALIAGALLYYLYFKLSERQRKAIQEKNKELARQKVEFQKESDLKDQKIDSLKEKNLQSELKHKSDELVKTTLNIVRKNEMLQEIKKEAMSISRSIDEENLPNVRRKMLRLIGHIDTNIEHDDDLQAFQNTFDSVHQDFFNKLDSRFPNLNKKEKLLCAYIKMDLMSKEIAPLMNISLRGVEISRYRLRKKLELSPEANLADFLQKL